MNIIAVLNVKQNGGLTELIIEMPTALLPGRYKGTRKKHPAPVLITIECPGCGWKSRPAKPEFAEKSYLNHLDKVHCGGLECAFGCDPLEVLPDFKTLAEHVKSVHPEQLARYCTSCGCKQTDDQRNYDRDCMCGSGEFKEIDGAIPPRAFNFDDGETRHHVSSLNGGNDMPLQRPIVPGASAVPGGKSAGNWLRDEDVTKDPQVVKIMDAKPDLSGRAAVIIKIQMKNGATRLDSLKPNNPNFAILFNAFGEDEKAWIGRYVNLFLEFDQFTERNWRRYQIAEVATAKK